MKWAICLLFLTGCGFQFGEKGVLSQYSTITVPYVNDDENGHLTNELVREFSRSGILTYKKVNGQLSLLVEFRKRSDQHIGYRRDRNSDGSVSSRLVPNEGRLTAEAEVSVVEVATGNTVLGPTIIEATVDYDHDYYTTQERAFRFSLGQLDEVSVAAENARDPLNRALAKRIVDFVKNYW